MTPAEERATAWWRLFNCRFRVYVQQRFFYNQPEFQASGIPTTGSRSWDREAAEEEVCIDISIAEMVEMVKNYQPIRFTSVEDLLIIWDIIRQHMTDWLERIRSAPYGVEAPPQEDFEALERLAEFVFNAAGGRIKAREEITTLLGQYNQEALSIFGTEPVPGRTNRPNEEKFESLSEPIEHVFQKRFKQWR